ncbi:MAG: hypothetical protein RI894_2644 [Bacteroidota bacterium]|jgi:hypothetical protein
MSMILNLFRVTPAELETYLTDSSLLAAEVYNDEKPNPKLTDIDKAWEGILFLLTGENSYNSVHELTPVIFGKQTLDPTQELGYGPAMFSTPQEVAELHQKLAGIAPSDLKARFSPDEMTRKDVYPNIWADNELAFDFLAVYFQKVQEIYAEAAKNGEAIITFLH